MKEVGLPNSSSGLVPTESLLYEQVCELPNEPNQHIKFIHYPRGVVKKIQPVFLVDVFEQLCVKKIVAHFSVCITSLQVSCFIFTLHNSRRG